MANMTACLCGQCQDVSGINLAILRGYDITHTLGLNNGIYHIERVTLKGEDDVRISAVNDAGDGICFLPINCKILTELLAQIR